jgi:hypothetical protein
MKKVNSEVDQNSYIVRQSEDDGASTFMDKRSEGAQTIMGKAS